MVHQEVSVRTYPRSRRSISDLNVYNIIFDNADMECSHDWKNDPMFEDGTVVMLTNIDKPLGKEMRQYCKDCGEVRYVDKIDRVNNETMS